MEPPAAVRAYAARLGASCRRRVIGVYVHGSAVLGDWDERGSDVDVLVVAESDGGQTVVDAIATLPVSPGTGLELSVVTPDAAANPAAPWPFAVHVTTAPDDSKLVWGEADAGDPDLILHYLVTRAAGWAATGPPPAAVIGAVPDEIVRAQLAAELQWAVAHASATYAVLNACRARRYVDDGVVSSKTAAGEWAVERGIEPVLVEAALDARRRADRSPPSEAASAFVLGVAERL
jgi:streptomycin 3"-adenylyltransferase